MKQQVSLPVVIAAIVVVIGIAAFAWFKFTGSPQGTAGDGPPPLPPSVSAELQKHQPRSGLTAPTSRSGPPTMVGGPGSGGSASMPPGMPGGMTAPPGPR